MQMQKFEQSFVPKSNTKYLFYGHDVSDIKINYVIWQLAYTNYATPHEDWTFDIGLGGCTFKPEFYCELPNHPGYIMPNQNNADHNLKHDINKIKKKKKISGINRIGIFLTLFFAIPTVIILFNAQADIATVFFCLYLFILGVVWGLIWVIKGFKKQNT